MTPLDWSLSGPIRGLRGDLQELILFPILRWFAKIEVIDRQYAESKRGPFVLVSNHTSHFDAPLILAALPHRLRQRTIIAAAADYFYKVQALGALASLAIGTVPFDREEGSRDSLDRCKEGIRRGWSVLLFPEGTRSRSGELGEFKKGAAYMSIDCHCSALPIRIEGAYDILPKGASFPRSGKVKVRFGPPLGPRPDDDYDSFTARLREAVNSLAS